MHGIDGANIYFISLCPQIHLMPILHFSYLSPYIEGLLNIKWKSPLLKYQGYNNVTGTQKKVVVC